MFEGSDCGGKRRCVGVVAHHFGQHHQFYGGGVACHIIVIAEVRSVQFVELGSVFVD